VQGRGCESISSCLFIYTAEGLIPYAIDKTIEWITDLYLIFVCRQYTKQRKRRKCFYIQATMKLGIHKKHHPPGSTDQKRRTKGRDQQPLLPMLAVLKHYASPEPRLTQARTKHKRLDTVL